jgi:hypothetical protein
MAHYLDLAWLVARVRNVVSSLGRPVCTGLKNRRSCTPSWSVAHPTGQSLKLGGGMDAYGGGGNLQSVLHHAGEVSAQNWSTGDRLCVSDANVLAEELEPLWLTVILSESQRRGFAECRSMPKSSQ